MQSASRYRLSRSIGRGGTAEVFEAFAANEHGFERRVALKHLLPELADVPEAVRAFIDEARIASRLSHMNLVSVLDTGVLEARPFLVMEYVDGLSIRELLRTDPISPELALFVTWEIANGLAHAHEARVVHRDLTPSNVLASWAGEVKLTDFGIALAAEKRARTAAGVVKGKRAYLAPEQYRGELVDARSDIFSLGVVLLEMAARENPLRDALVGDHVLAGGEVPIPNAQRVPEQVRALVRRMTAERDRRPSAREVAAACAVALSELEVPDPRRMLAEHLARLRPSAVEKRGALSVLLDVEIVLEASAPSDPTDPSSPTDPESRRFTEHEATALATVVRDPYRRLDRIGAGSFGEIYRAVEEKSGRIVALKVLRAALVSGHRLRFSREGTALLGIRHENLVEVLDAGVAADGSPWFAMELLPGRTLAAALENGPFPLPRALNIARQLAAGLSAIHAAGWVHRDLKPSNVMIFDDQQAKPASMERVKILDFGVSRIVDPAGGLTRLTKPGDLLGSLRWMAPEQAVDAYGVDHRADLYGLGLLMMRMVEGKEAFEGEPREVLRRRLVSERPPLLRAGALAPVIGSLLERDPARRPADTRAVLSALQALDLEAKRRNPWRLPALLLFGVVLLLGAMLARGRKPSAAPPPVVVVQPIRIQATPRAAARAIETEIEEAELEPVPPKPPVAARPPSVQRRTGKPESPPPRPPPSVPELEARLQRFRERLASERSTMTEQRLTELEQRYLELRTKVQAGLTAKETQRLTEKIAELELTLP